MKQGRIFLLLLIMLIAGCKQEPQTIGPLYSTTPSTSGLPVYSFAVHPLHNPKKLSQTYQPLIDYLNRNLDDARLALEASRDYANFEEKYRKRKPAFLLPNPWQTVEAMKVGYHVLAMAGEPEDFKGIFIVRKDKDIREPADLKGKAVSYPSRTALAACIMPQYFLYQHGIDINREIENRYVGSQESAIMNAFLGQTSAGATWPPPWRAFQKDHPREAGQLKMIWETEPLINNSVMARDDVPTDVSRKIAMQLAGLNETEEGKAILVGMETARFIPASDKDYDVVRAYVARFEKEVRSVEEK